MSNSRAKELIYALFVLMREKTANLHLNKVVQLKLSYNTFFEYLYHHYAQPREL